MKIIVISSPPFNQQTLNLTMKTWCCEPLWNTKYILFFKSQRWIYLPEKILHIWKIHTFALYVNMTGVQQTQIVFNNISIISSKFFFLALHICQRQSLSKFFLKIHRVSKVRFMRFYYLKTDFIRILLIKPHKSNFWYPMYFELKLR